MSVQSMTGLLKSYREELLNLYINQRIGNKLLGDYLPKLRDGHDELQKKKKNLTIAFTKTGN